MTKCLPIGLILVIWSFLAGCADNAGNSVVNGVNSTNSAVSKAWGTAQLIEMDDTGTAVLPDVAVNGSGDALVVWMQHDGTRYNILANHYVAATNTWGTAQLIEADNAGGAHSPQVAVDGNGNAVAVWYQSDGTRFNIWANRYVAATNSWGTAQPLETDNTGEALSPQVAVDGSGNAVAVWQQSNGGLNNIWANRYVAATNSWGTAQLIENDFGNASVPQVAVDSSGNAVAVWRQFDGTRASIWSNRYVAATNTWGTAQLIIENNFGGSDGVNVPQVAIDGSGNAVAVWTHWQTLVNIVANRYVAAANTWGTAQLLEIDNSGHASVPQVAVDGSGNTLVVWDQSDGTHYNIWANRYVAATNTWGTEQLIETDNTSDALYPQVAVNGSGDAVVAWEQSDGTSYSIWANRYVAATNTWGTAQIIENNFGSALLPQVGVDSSGNAVVAWEQSDNRSPQNISNIWVSHYR